MYLSMCFLKLRVASTVLTAAILPSGAHGAESTPSTSAEEPEQAITIAGRSIEIEIIDPLSKRQALDSLSRQAETLLKEVASAQGATASWAIHLELEGHQRNFQILISVIRPKGRTERAPIAISCDCTYDKLPAVIEPSLRLLIRDLEPQPAVASTVPPPPPLLSPERQATGEPPTSLPPEEPATRRPFGVMSGIAVGLMGIGAAGSIFGIVRAVQGTERIHGDLADIVRSYETPTSIGIGIAGGVLLATGTALLIVDRTVCRKRARGCRPNQSPSPSRASIGLTLRF